MTIVRCITCANWTLQPRQGEEFKHYKASDIAHARAGYGRCLKHPGELHWLPGEEERVCGKFEAAEDGTAAKRREWLKGRRG